METKDYRWIDKSQWDRGPWDNEPDKIQWQDRVTGLPCLAVRNEYTGNWCGYVGINEDHPYFERDYELVDVECHGGLTFSDHCMEHGKEHGICHIPGPVEPDNVWWLGFDCGHAFDLMPATVARLRKYRYNSLGDTYRTLRYVKGQCRKLAKQLAAVQS